MEQVSYVCDHTQRRTVNGYELVAFGLITPTNFYPLDFCHRFSDKRHKQKSVNSVAFFESTSYYWKGDRKFPLLSGVEIANVVMENEGAGER